jgi:hypothetical protein
MANIIIKDEIGISANQAIVWNQLTDISRWSRWSRLIRRAAVYGPVKSGTEFKCLIRKWDFDGKISGVMFGSSIVYNLKTSGLRLQISWQLINQNNNSKVQAEIVAIGWIAVIFKRKVERVLTDDLFTLLYALKTTLERGEKEAPAEKHGLSKPARRYTFPGPLSFLFKRKDDE